MSPRGRPRRSIRDSDPPAYGFEATATPKHEAEVIFQWVCRRVETVESARALIGMPPQVRSVLKAAGYRKRVQYRDDVSVEFEKLCVASRALMDRFGLT